VRFLFLTTEFPPSRGGIQTFSHELPRALAEKGHQVAVAVLEAGGAAACDSPFPFPVVRRAQLLGRLGAIRALQRGCLAAAGELTGPPDWLVAMKWFPEGPAALLARRRLRCPLALVAHGHEFLLSTTPAFRRLLKRAVLRRTAVVLTNSRYTADIVLAAGMPPERVATIYCGVRPERYQVQQQQVSALRRHLGLEGKRVLLTAGRLVPRKGQDLVIQALPQVLSRVPEAHYLIVGSGEEEDRLRALASQCGVEGAVTIRTDIGDAEMPLLFHLCELFVMPSREIPGMLIEGFGIVYLEAAACGKPCIAGRSGGAPEAVEEEVTGLVVDPADRDELAAAVLSLLNDSETALRMGEAGRQRVLGHFTWSHVADRFLAALASHTPRTRRGWCSR